MKLPSFSGRFFLLFAKSTGVSLQDEASRGNTMEQNEQKFLDGVVHQFCPQCGRAIVQNRTGRHRKFCSDACRRQWWNHHPMPEHWKSVRKAVCPVCGKEYKADRKRLMNHLSGHTAFRTPEAQEKAKRKVQNQTNQTAETER